MEFSFYCHPYLLKLTFPHELDGEDETRCKATYDPNTANGTMVAHLPKKLKGQHFPDLDLTTMLLQKKKPFANTSAAPLIEVLSSSSSTSTTSKATETASEEEDEEFESTQAEDLSSLLLSPLRPRYGFNNGYSGALLGFREELVDMLELSDSDGTPEHRRRPMRLDAEDLIFDPERYLGDLYGASSDSIFVEAISFEPFWSRQWNYWKASLKQKTLASSTAEAISEVGEENPGHLEMAANSTTPLTLDKRDAAFEAPEGQGAGGFSDEEREVLSRSLPHKEYLVTAGSRDEKNLLLGLADILFAFCFTYRTTMGDSNVESAHNMTRCSALLSWLDSYREPTDDVTTVILNSARRSLCYPYLRVWKLTRKVLADVAKVLFLGKRCILKCLLQARAIFEHTDSHYMLNKLFLDDYCIYIQSVDASSIDSLAREYNTAKSNIEKEAHTGKARVGFSLVEIEQWAEQAEDDEDALTNSIPKGIYIPSFPRPEAPEPLSSPLEESLAVLDLRSHAAVITATPP